MGFIKFEIESYKVAIVQDTDLRYEIKIVSKPLATGARYFARVGFDDTNSFADKNRIGYIIIPPGSGTDPINIVIDCEQDGFPGFYQVLSTEKPVYLSIAYNDKVTDTPKNSRFIIQMQFTTDSEIPGDFEKQ